jgi:hypothetical protein
MASRIEVGDKKQYNTPRLANYGSVQRLTQSTGSSTTGDNPQFTNNKRRNTFGNSSQQSAPAKRR